MEILTGRLVVFAQHTDRFIVENGNMDSETEAEAEMSLKSGSFLHKVNDQVRKWQNQSSIDAANNIGSICIHGEELLGKFLNSFNEISQQSHDETHVRAI